MNNNIIMNKKQEDDELWSHAMTIISGSVYAMVLKTAIELDVLEIIKRAGPGAYLSPEEITAQLPAAANPDAATTLDRVLRLLSSYSIPTCALRSLPGGGVQRLSGLAPVCKYLTKNEDGVSLAPFHLLPQDKDVMSAWRCCIQQGIWDAFARVLGHRCKASEFVKNTMSDHSTLITRKLLDTYTGFEGLTWLVDVGGGSGATLSMIISKHPSIKGINFDLPYAIKEAPDYPGVEHIAGDFYVSVPKGDAIMQWTVHIFGDEECLKLLRNCHEALPDHGKAIVCEDILPVVPEPSDTAKTIFVVDALMLAHNYGNERTEEEFRALGIAAGFQDFREGCSCYDMKIIEFLKKI
ncbi:Caffeic acid 3-O-methyltransferase-like protein [Drosera capensis]